MKFLKPLIFISFIQFAHLSAIEKLPENHKTKAKNIILMIGDGMSLPQVYAGYTANQQYLNMFLMPYLGLSITYSADNYITDSAAGGTAISSGKKTKNGMIAKDSTGNDLETILEIAKKNKLATGLVATSAITHATPASFIAHVNSRGSQDSIALFFLSGNADVFIGGGFDYFAKRTDKRDLMGEMQKKGFEMYTKLEDVEKSKSTKIGCLLAPDGMPKFTEGRGDMLPKATKLAIEKMKNDPDGFFLMIEGSQIDWGGHNNDFQYVVNETKDFDRAIGEALKFAAEDGNTLVIVTADHETGGLTLTGGNLKGDMKFNFSSTYHTAIPVLVYSYGPGAQNFTGVFDNTAIFQKMLQSFQFIKQ